MIEYRIVILLISTKSSSEEWSVGFIITVHKLAEGGKLPPTWDSAKSQEIAHWGTTRATGMKWIISLVTTDHAFQLFPVPLGDYHWGNPDRYAAQAKYLVQQTTNGPSGPMSRQKPRSHFEIANKCHPNEWLLIDAWDENQQTHRPRY